MAKRGGDTNEHDELGLVSRENGPALRKPQFEPSPLGAAVRHLRARFGKLRYDGAFALLMAILAMGLAIVAAGPGAGIILAAVVAGVGIAVLHLWTRRE